MFGKMQRVRLKSAEQAVRDGRLDDAYRLVSDAALAATPRGQRVLADLGNRFVERGREHYRSDRFTEALLDIGKAQQCGANGREVIELREQVIAVADEVARQSAERQDKINRARQRIGRGSIAGGRRILGQLDANDPAAEQLNQRLAEQQNQAQSLIKQAKSLLNQNQLERAAVRLAEAMQLNAHDPDALHLEQRLCDRVTHDARLAFESGALKRARRLVESLASLGADHTNRCELNEMFRLVDDAAAELGKGCYERALTRVNRLLRLTPNAEWVRQTAQDLAKVDAALLAISSGPLGENLSQAGVVTEPVRPRPANRILRVEGPSADSTPRQLLVLIDGGGSFLLLSSGRVSIGRTAASSPADIPLFSDLSERHAELMRVEDDYFVTSPHDIEVAGRPTRQKLLRDGDRVVLSRRAKFTFCVPSRKSASARLDLSDSTKMPHDVRKVVLFDRIALIGRGSHCHLTVPSAGGSLVLYQRAGQLWLRPSGQGAAPVQTQPITLGESIEMEGIRIVVKQWEFAQPKLA